MANTLLNDLREVRRRKLEYDKASAAKKKAEEAFKKKQQEVFDRMEAEEAGSMADKRTGRLFVPTETVYAQVQDRSEFIKWAKEEDELLIKEVENGELINALVRERLDNGEALPPGLGVRVKQYIADRAA
jgi:hypothetical protein